MSEQHASSELNSEDDLAIVLEAIDFMARLTGLSPESRRKLEQIRKDVKTFQGDAEP